MPEEKETKKENKKHFSGIQHIKLIIILVILNLAVLNAYVLLFMTIGSRSAHVSELTQEIERQVKKEKEVKTLKDIINDTAKEREKLGTYFLYQKDIVSFIEKVELLGEHAGLVLDFKEVGVQNVLDKEVLGLQFDTSGSFENTIHFLSLFELFPYALSFEKAFIEEKGDPSDKKSEKSKWKGSFNVSLLSFVPE